MADKLRLLAQNDTNNLFRNILLTEKGDSGGGKGGASKEDIISAVAADIASKIPPNFDMEAAQIRYPVRWEESMNTVLCQVSLIQGPFQLLSTYELL